MVFSLISKLKDKLEKLFKKECHCRNEDEIHLDLDGLEIDMERCFAYDRPHEVTVVVPRAEIRKRLETEDKTKELEILLNSITIVHSPYRSSDEGEGPPPQPPEIPRDDEEEGDQEKR
ncbi:hypothetical protein Halha_0447 [Halobacteroides halobius DSM 5150]|uniref:Uncharacterized protein n=1 Tax=Halobacteroides halobius (strain ATCC 35273 / DSM 5150 / MD-1) TaxID=748449 RepID=L0K7W0_HALHC|nr:hypothetical protein [Halobacteroides halobius]AGB40439.1 hypothetical protein Halha_0447 [Halobacteroides halobius DSM 5150]